jgi:hypothetical protein
LNSLGLVFEYIDSVSEDILLLGRLVFLSEKHLDHLSLAEIFIKSKPLKFLLCLFFNVRY